MKYDHTVKYNGVYYHAGEDVPEETIPFSDIDEKKPYTKTEINRMSKAELVELALQMGATDANEMTGADLKEFLIEKFEL